MPYQMNSPDPEAIARLRRLFPLALIASGLLLWAMAEGLLMLSPDLVGIWVGDPLLNFIRYGVLAIAALFLMAAFFFWGRAAARRSPAEDARAWVLEVVAYACADGVVMLGLILFLLSGNRIDFYVPALPGILAMIRFYTARRVREI